MRLHKRLTDLLAAVAVVAWAPFAIAGPPPGDGLVGPDFDADGKADVALEGGGDVQVRHLDGTSVVGVGLVPNAAGSFDLKALGNLNNDGNSDLVFQGNGTIRVSFMNAGGTAQTATPLFIADGGGTWNVVAACDVTGDGVDEVIAVGTGAALGAARVTNVSSGAPVHSFLSTAGGIWGWGFCLDADGDDQQDLYFVGSGAAAGIGRVNLSGGVTALFYALGGGVWEPVGAGKTTGTGSDSLIDNGTGAALGFVRVRTLDGTGAVTGSGFIPNGGGTQAFVFAGDFNDDTRADLAFRAGTTHKLVLMGADGITPEGAAAFPGAAGGTAELDQGADTNGDGVVDLISLIGTDVFVQTINPANPGVPSGAAVLNAGGRTLF